MAQLVEFGCKGNLVRRPAGVLLLCLCSLMPWATGCGLFGGGQQLKQLQNENDRLLAEYRAQRERLTQLQETNAALEARVGEAERLLAQRGQGLPSSRISRAQPRPSGLNPPGNGTAAPSIPPYVPPSVPSLPGSTGQGGTSDASTGGDGGQAKWRPVQRP